MRSVGESCVGQAVAGQEATRTVANAFDMHERGPQELTPPAAEMGGADPSIRVSAARISPAPTPLDSPPPSELEVGGLLPRDGGLELAVELPQAG